MNDITKAVKEQRRFFQSGETKKLEFRLAQLRTLYDAIIKNENEISEALKKDLNKSPFESYETEIGLVLDEIKYNIKHLRKWAAPKKVKTPIMHFLSASSIYSEPYGAVLIMAPWNYPFQLALSPLVGAVAAGNCAVIKPSNYSPNTSAIIGKIIAENFSENYIAVAKGGRELNRSLLLEKFDYIFFTGSVSVGRAVMEAASKNLTPVTLELGGKSPCIVDETARIDLAAKRIVWGKFTNAGQTCVAPDYILAHRGIKNVLIDKMREHIAALYGEQPLENADYPKIINEKHFARLINLMKNENVVFGGQCDEKTNRIAPAIIDGADWSSPVMQEEIFGPLLPVIEFDNLSEAVSLVGDRPKPLALYLFTNDKSTKRDVIGSLSFGGGCVNDTVVHLATPYLPFGGVGESGMGAYHGKAGFDTFTHKKSILRKTNLFDVPLRYPSLKNNLSLLKKFLG